jgi:hypothetical protein
MASDKVRQLEDNLIFKQMTTAAADKTAVDFLSKPDRITSKDVHSMLMAAGFTPGLGNVADAADALLYAAEGEYGAAGLSMAAMIPFIGQAVSAKKALKVAKESGEKITTLYRAVDEWHPARHMLTGGKHKGKIIDTGERMVKNKMYVGGGDFTDLKHVPTEVREYVQNKLGRSFLKKEAIWTTDLKLLAENYKGWTGSGAGRMLKFEVPESYIHKHALEWRGQGIDPTMKRRTLIFEEGLPTAFLTKVSK